MKNEYGFTHYAVGEKYDKVMGKDGAIFEMYDGMAFINIGLTNMLESEKALFEKGKLDVYLSVIEGVVFIVASFADAMVLDMPFNAGLYNEFNFQKPDGGYICPVIAIENSTNIIETMRCIGFDAEFSRKLYEFSMKQITEKIENYDERLKSIYSRYSSRDIIKFAIHKNIMKDVKF